MLGTLAVGSDDDLGALGIGSLQSVVLVARLVVERGIQLARSRTRPGAAKVSSTGGHQRLVIMEGVGGCRQQAADRAVRPVFEVAGSSPEAARVWACATSTAALAYPLAPAGMAAASARTSGTGPLALIPGYHWPAAVLTPARSLRRQWSWRAGPSRSYVMSC